MKSSAFLVAALLLGAAPAFAQETAPPAANPDSERVNLVIVYGDDPCPKQTGEDIVVCGRQEEKDRYRIPETLRGDPNAPANQAWGQRFKALEYVGKTGTESCTPVGGGGFTGCFNQLARTAKAEKQQLANASWGDLVAAERAKRLSTIDADSEVIEARVKAEEAAKANPAPAPVAPPPPQ